MNANELADLLADSNDPDIRRAVAMLRQQQAEIEALKAGKIRAYDNGVEDGRKPNTNPVKDLTDEKINKLWAESHEDGIAIQQGFTTQQHYFAHLILRKASEK
jgi:hypothetical protein